MHIVEANYRSSSLPTISGYGFIPYDADKQALYTDAASALFEAVSSGVLPARDEAWKRRCNNLARLFGSVSSQGDAAWFVNSEMLGHPSPEIAGRMIGLMNKLGWAIKGQNARGFSAAVEAFTADYGDEMLDSYLDVVVRGNKPVSEPEWAYILSSNSANGVLRIGATTDDLRALASSMNRSVNSNSPVSVLAAWPVHDADEARITLEIALRSYRASEGNYFIKLGNAKAIVEQGLKETDNFVLSPFHVDDDEPNNTPSKVPGY